WSSIFAIGVIANVGKFSVLYEFVYRAGIFVPSEVGKKPFNAPFRLDLTGGVQAHGIERLLLLRVDIAYCIYLFKTNAAAKMAGKYLLIAAFIAQIASVGLLVNGVRSTQAVLPELQKQLAADPDQYMIAGLAIAEGRNMTTAELAKMT